MGLWCMQFINVSIHRPSTRQASRYCSNAAVGFGVCFHHWNESTSLFAYQVAVKLFLFLFQVFKNLKLFMNNKQGGDDLFDCLNVSLHLWTQSFRVLTAFLSERVCVL